MNAKVFKTAAAAAALVALLAAGAQASNVVGYIKVEIPAGLSLVSVPFETVGGGVHTLGSVFGDKLGDGSEIIMFTQGVGYEIYIYYEDSDPEYAGWFKGAEKADTKAIDLGSGFWVRNNSGGAVTLVLRGQVPTADRNVPLNVGLQIVSYGYPSSAELQTVEGLTPADGDEIIAYQPGVGFVIYIFYEDSDPQYHGWFLGPVKTDLMLEPGKAWWYRRASSNTVWTQRKNFSL